MVVAAHLLLKDVKRKAAQLSASIVRTGHQWAKIHHSLRNWQIQIITDRIVVVRVVAIRYSIYTVPQIIVTGAGNLTLLDLLHRVLPCELRQLVTEEVGAADTASIMLGCHLRVVQMHRHRFRCLDHIYCVVEPLAILVLHSLKGVGIEL